MDLEAILTTALSRICSSVDLESVLASAASLIPTEIDITAVMKFLLFYAAGSLILGVLGRIFLGKRSSLNHSVSAAMGILFIYTVTIVVYTFMPWNLTELLSPLPFVTFAGDYLVIFPFQGAGIPAICSQVLSMIILAFLFNLLDSLIPNGKSMIGWFCYRVLSVILAMGLHLVVTWVFRTFLPNVLVTYAPIILLAVLMCMLLLGILNVILGLVLTAVNPIIGGIYAFFFSNMIGKQLTKAVFTAGILCIVVFLLGHFGYTVICITQAALMAYIPLVAALLILWFLLGHVL